MDLFCSLLTGVLGGRHDHHPYLTKGGTDAGEMRSLTRDHQGRSGRAGTANLGTGHSADCLPQLRSLLSKGGNREGNMLAHQALRVEIRIINNNNNQIVKNDRFRRLEFKRDIGVLVTHRLLASRSCLCPEGRGHTQAHSHGGLSLPGWGCPVQVQLGLGGTKILQVILWVPPQ